jgi:hypothetical protein
LIGVRRRLASGAEQRASQDRRQKIADARPRRSRRGNRFRPRRNRRISGRSAIVRAQFHGDHAAEESATGNDQNKDPVDHRRALTAVSL